MNIEVFTITYNEEKMLPFFLKHYSKFCNRINIFDNQSNDTSDHIFDSFKGCELIINKYDTNNTLNDSAYLNIKNNCWKNSKCDYVIIVDCDEFIYSEDINSFIKDRDCDIYQPYGYDMCSVDFPVDDIIQEIKTGTRSPNYDKCCIFNPSKIKHINYGLGCHQASPINYDGQQVTPSRFVDLKLLHYKNISFNYRIKKHQEYMNRLSDFNKSTGSGIHYTYNVETQLQEFENIRNQSTIII